MSRTLRALLSAAVAAMLPLLSVTPALGAVPSPRANAAASRYDTAIRYLTFHHVRAYGAPVTISGQVTATVNGTTGAISGASVSLYRRMGSSLTWERVDTTTTSQTSTPEFQFAVTANASADYQVRFAGASSYQSAEGTTTVAVHRLISGRIEDHSGRFHGRVTPGYAHRWVHLEKRTCATCGWELVRTARAGDHGRYRFTVGAPQKGHWYWRVTTQFTSQFVRSSSGVFATRLV